MYDKYTSRLKIVGEHEIAEYLEKLQSERDSAFDYIRFLLVENERADCSVCKRHGSCDGSMQHCKAHAEFMPGGD